MTEPQNTETAVAPSPAAGIAFGQTNLRPQDFVPPRVKVLQPMSQEVQDSLGQPGELFNTLTGENYGESMTIQPILPFMARIFLVRKERRNVADKALKDAGLPKLSGNDGLKCRSQDMIQGVGEPGVACEACPLSAWTAGPGGDQVPPLCTETYNVAAMNEDGELVIVQFQKSSAKIGKKIFSAIRFNKGAPWTRLYTLQTHREQNDQGTFFVPAFTISKDRPAPELLRQALWWAGQLAGVGPIDVTPVDEDEPIDGAEGGDPDDENSPF